MNTLNSFFNIMKVFVMLLLLTAFNERRLQKVDALAWLVGTWKIDTGQGVVVETWRVLNDSTLSGSSVFVKTGKDTIPHESLALSFRNGEWTYISTVQGQNNNRAVPFKMVFLKGTEFICENPTHDFPQRIAYRRIGHQLFASVEGRKNGRIKKENFDFIKGDASDK